MMIGTIKHLAKGGRASVACLCLVGAIAVGCGGDDSEGSPSSDGDGGAPPSADLVLPYPPNLYDVASMFAAERFFEEEGVDVTLQTTDGSPVVVQQLVSGNADFGISASVAVLSANAQGADLRGIAAVSRNGAARLSVLADSPIQSLRDLEGKAIGIPSLSDGSVALLTAAARDEGLDVRTDMRLVVVGEGGPAVAAALKSGRISAYSAGGSDEAGLRVAGDVELRSIMPEKYAGLPDTVYVTTQEVLDDPAGRETALKIGRALIRGAEYARTHPAEALRVGCEMFPEQCTNEDVARVSVDVGTEVFNPPAGDEPAVMDPEKMQVYVDAMKAADQLPQDVPAADAFPNDYVDEIVGDVSAQGESQ